MQSQVRLRRYRRLQIPQNIRRYFARPTSLFPCRALHLSGMQKCRRDLFRPALTHAEPYRQMGKTSLTITMRFQYLPS